MRIRPATLNDQPAVHALICELEGELMPPDSFAPTYAANLVNPNIRYWVAEGDDGALLGFVSLHLEQPLHAAGLVGEVQELIVREAARGRGLGKALLDAAVRGGRAAGCLFLQLHSNLRRTEAHAFYEHNGWRKRSFHFTHGYPGEE